MRKTNGKRIQWRFVRAEKSCDKNYLNFIVILVKTFMKLVPETL